MIRKLVVASIITFTCIHTGSAQENKNRFMVNGNGNFSTGKREIGYINNADNKNIQRDTYGNVDLNIGYFLTNKLAIGITGGTDSRISKHIYKTPIDNNTYKTKQLLYNAGVFIRHNQTFGSSKFGIFGQLSTSYGWGKVQASSSNTPKETISRLKGFEASLVPGFLYFINNKLSLEAGLGNISYSYTNRISESGINTLTETSNDFNLNFSPRYLYLGVTFYFGGKNGSSATGENK